MQYRPRRLANRLFEQRIDRDDTLRCCYDKFNKLLTTYEACFKSNFANPLRVPIIALTAAPGSGKTFFVDELGELRDDDIAQFCAIESRRDAFKSALVLKVSYNGFSNVMNPADLANVGLCARIIWGYTVVRDFLGSRPVFL